jgi:site-specific recombinase XerD
LRHTFASHVKIGNGNILNLQRILGHSDLKMTLRYAHLAPDHLEEALKLNPLKKLSSNTVEPLLNLR